MFHRADEVFCGAGHGGFSPREMRYYRSFWEEKGKAAFREYLENSKTDGGDEEPVT